MRRGDPFRQGQDGAVALRRKTEGEAPRPRMIPQSDTHGRIVEYDAIGLPRPLSPAHRRDTLAVGSASHHPAMRPDKFPDPGLDMHAETRAIEYAVMPDLGLRPVKLLILG